MQSLLSPERRIIWRIRHLGELIDHYQICSVINLRGGGIGDQWLRAEQTVVKTKHVKYYHLPIPALALPTVSKLQQLIYMLKIAPQPVLIHCMAGAYCTGLASAIVILLNNGSFAQASRQVSYEYLAFSPHSTGRLVLPKYHAWLLAHHYSSTRQHFMTWVGSLSQTGLV